MKSFSAFRNREKTESGVCSPPFYIKSANKGLVLAATQEGDGSSVVLVSQTFEGTSVFPQLWQWRTDSCLQNCHSKLLLDVIQTHVDNEKEYTVVTSLAQDKKSDATTENKHQWTLWDRHFLTFVPFNQCLGIVEQRGENGRLTLVALNSSVATRWVFEFLPVPFYIRNRATGLVMDVFYKHREPGTSVILFRQKRDSFFNSNQLWRFRLNGAIESVDSGLVLDASTRKNKLVVYTHYDTPNQRWTYDGRRLMCHSNNFVADIQIPDKSRIYATESELFGVACYPTQKSDDITQEWDLVVFEPKTQSVPFSLLKRDDSKKGFTVEQRLEIRMFSEQINELLKEDNSVRHLLPINPDNPYHFLDVIQHGLVPLKLLEMNASVRSQYFSRRSGNGVGHGFLYTAIDLIGYSMVQMNQILTYANKALDFVWDILQLVAMSDVANIDHFLNDWEENNQIQGNRYLRKFEILTQLKKWIDYHLQKFDTTIVNFREDFKDGKLLLQLLYVVAGSECGLESLPDINKMSIEERIQKIIMYAQKLNLGKFVTKEAITNGTSRTNCLIVLNLYRRHPAIGLCSHAVLITQCLQQDFCALVPEEKGLPTNVHIGHKEAKRLLGENPNCGPLAQLLKWAYSQPLHTISIIHIRDWHDAKDVSQQIHLQKFGIHCIENTSGADFVCGIDTNKLQRNEWIINATGLNDFKETELKKIIERIKQEVKCQQLRVGIVGVWTDAKVSYLCYDLKTRKNLGVTSLATCSALTASFSRSKHFNALEQLKSLLDVRVFATVQEFTRWLLPNSSIPTWSEETSPFFAEIEENVSLHPEEKRIIGMLFRNSSRVRIVDKLTGGFSGARVLLASSYDVEGHEQGPFVIKLGWKDDIIRERLNFERVEEILGNNAPALLCFAEADTRGGIKFAFASHEGDAVTLKSVVNQLSQSELDKILRKVFGNILSRFYLRASYEQYDLLKSYDFDGKGWGLNAGGSDHIPHLKKRIRDLFHEINKQNETFSLSLQQNDRQAEIEDLNNIITPDILTFPGEGNSYRNVVFFLENELEVLKEWSKTQSFPLSIVHGDLNLSNIILDQNKNVWLIDFYYTTKSHVLKDVLKVENDLLYCETNVADESALVDALSLTKQLIIRTNDYTENFVQREMPKEIKSARFVRAWNNTKTLRQLAKQIDSSENVLALSVTLLRYALHTMTLSHLNVYQKLWALASACVHAENIVYQMKLKKIL